MKENKKVDTFLALVRAGLWETEARLPTGGVDWPGLLRLAQEQAVVGLVAAGLEHVPEAEVAKKDALAFVGSALQLEQRNAAMNHFIGGLVERMRAAGILAVLVKGQGVAQCYARPLWRACGDVDFLLDEENYAKAKRFLIPLAASVDHEGAYGKHQGMSMEGWTVELHGNLRGGISSRMDRVLDAVQEGVFAGVDVRSWRDGETEVLLPGADADVLFVFTHFLKHFYKGGIGLRQICDWCRLLWTFRDTLDVGLLEARLRAMGVVSEWRAFGAFAVEYMGMPVAAMPLYSAEAKWSRKAARICAFVMEVGNLGHNRDLSYISKRPYLVRKLISMGRRVADACRHARIFPLDSLRFLPRIVLNGLRGAVRGE